MCASISDYKRLCPKVSVLINFSQCYKLVFYRVSRFETKLNSAMNNAAYMILRRSDTQKNSKDAKASQQDTVSATDDYFRRCALSFCFAFFSH